MCGAAGSLCYSSFLFAPLMGSRLNPVNSFVSELELVGQPANAFFRATSIAAGLLITGFALGLARRVSATQAARLGCLCLAAVGLASIADGLRPMVCDLSTDPTCSGRFSVAGVVAELRQPHTLSSVLGIVAAIGAMLLIGAHLRRHDPRSRLGPISQAAGSVLTLLAGLETPLAFGGHGAGLLQRVHVLVIAGWLAGLSWRCWTAGLIADGLARRARASGPRRAAPWSRRSLVADPPGPR
jgi:hypothetical protein